MKEYFSERIKMFEITIEPILFGKYDVGIYVDETLVRKKKRFNSLLEAQVYFQEKKEIINNILDILKK